MMKKPPIDKELLKEIRQRVMQARPVKQRWPDNTPKLNVSIDHQYFTDLKYLLSVVEALADNPPDSGPVAANEH